MRHVTNSQDDTAVQVEAYPGQARLVAVTTIDRSRTRKGEIFHTALLTPAEVGALIASLQMCGEHVENWDRDNAAERAGTRCHGDQCAAGQMACPSPKACGVAA